MSRESQSRSYDVPLSSTRQQTTNTNGAERSEGITSQICCQQGYDVDEVTYPRTRYKQNVRMNDLLGN